MRSLLFCAIAALAICLSGCASMVATSGQVTVKDGASAPAREPRFSANDRAAIEKYYAARRKASTAEPPSSVGLPQKLRKYDKLPPGLATSRLPADLESRLTRLPTGYVRLRAGSDVVLIESRGRAAIDWIRRIAY